MEKKLLIEVEAEKSVLAAAILDPSVFPAARGILRPIDFGRSAHQVIWKAMEGIADQGEPIDQLTLKHFLDTHGALEQIGGASYILDLASCSFAITNWASHARIVKTMSVLNQLERRRGVRKGRPRKRDRTGDERHSRSLEAADDGAKAYFSTVEVRRVRRERSGRSYVLPLLWTQAITGR